MKHNKILSGLLATVMMFSATAFANAIDTDSQQTWVDEEGYIVCEAVREGPQSRIGTAIGGGQVRYNTLTNNASARTYTESWGQATYLYAKATVTATGFTQQSASISKDYDGTKAGLSLTTSNVKCTKKENRKVSTSHTVKGKHGATGKSLTEYYSGSANW